MSAVHLGRPHIPPIEDRPTVPPKPPGGKLTLRWRIRRWVLKRLDAWPRARPEPRTEWGELRRAERKRLVQENRRLRALEDRLTRYLDYSARGGTTNIRVIEDVRYLVRDGHLDEMLAEFAETGDELAAEYVREDR